LSLHLGVSRSKDAESPKRTQSFDRAGVLRLQVMAAGRGRFRAGEAIVGVKLSRLASQPASSRF
jgi:hypothetical protein